MARTPNSPVDDDADKPAAPRTGKRSNAKSADTSAPADSHDAAEDAAPATPGTAKPRRRAPIKSAPATNAAPSTRAPAAKRKPSGAADVRTTAPAPRRKSPAARPTMAARTKPASAAPARGTDAKTSRGGRTLIWSLGGAALATGAGVIAYLRRGRIARALGSTAEEGHVPHDLLDPAHKPDDRADPAFRPDMDAPMTASERAALAPATRASPSLTADRGSMNAQ